MAATASLAQTVARPALVTREMLLRAGVLAALCGWTVLAVGGQAGEFPGWGPPRT